jgi:hypothetical protein
MREMPTKDSAQFSSIHEDGVLVAPVTYHVATIRVRLQAAVKEMSKA